MEREINASTGLLTAVRQVASPHCDARPAGATLDLIVLHGISLPPGDFGGPWIDRLFTGSLPCDAHPYFAQIGAARVSAHVLVRRDGEVVQYVPFGLRAWHAGVSQYQGRSACNDFSVGIEFEGTDESPYEDAQYEAGGAILRALLRTYSTLHRQRIVAHSEIAPGRKTDPGESFDWARMRALLE